MSNNDGQRRNYCGADGRCNLELTDSPISCTFFMECNAPECNDFECDACHYDVKGEGCTSKEAIKAAKEESNGN